MTVAVGGLLAAGALYVHFFGWPGADSQEGQAKLQAGLGNVALTSNGNSDPAAENSPGAASLPVRVVEFKPRKALAPSFKMFTGDKPLPPPSQASSATYEVTCKSEFPPDATVQGLPETLRFRGKVSVTTKPSTNYPIDNGSQPPEFFPPETIASGLRLPEGLYIIPLRVHEYADFTSVFDGENKYDVDAVPVLKKGRFRVFFTKRRPDFPRVIASDASALNGDTKGVSLAWVDRNSEIHTLEDLDATGWDPNTNEVTFEVPYDSAGGIIIDDAGKVAGLVSKVEDGIGTVTQISTIKDKVPLAAAEIFDFSRLPIAKDKAGKLREAAACLVQVHCIRDQSFTHAAFTSDIEVLRGTDQSSKQVFNDKFEFSFQKTGEAGHFSMTQGAGCRLPGFLGFPGTTSVIAFPKDSSKSEWKIENRLKLGPVGNERMLVGSLNGDNELDQIIQTDEYQVLEDTPEYMTIERNYVAKSATIDPDESPEGAAPPGYPFLVEGRFTYRYNKALKLATSVVFEGVEQKRISEGVVVPMNLSFEMKSIPNE